MLSTVQLHHDALLAWVSDRPFGVAGTLTFRPFLKGDHGKRCYLTARAAQSSINLYLRRLDRAAFGSAGVRKGRRVGAIAVREGGDDWSSKHLHYHFALAVPDGHTAEDWAGIAERTWTSLDWSGPDQNVLKPMWSDQWLSYIFKTRDKANYLDAMDFENWRLV